MADFLEMIHFSRGLTLDSENLFFSPLHLRPFMSFFAAAWWNLQLLFKQFNTQLFMNILTYLIFFLPLYYYTIH